jgi:hypothetical protein
MKQTSFEHIGRSQLIPGVRRTWWDGKGAAVGTVAVVVRNVGISLALHASVFLYSEREAGLPYPVPFHRWVLTSKYLRVEVNWLRCTMVAVCFAGAVGFWYLACQGQRGWARMAGSVVAANAASISAAACLCHLVWGGGTGAVYLDVIAEALVDALSWAGVVIVLAVLSGILGTWAGGGRIVVMSPAGSAPGRGGAA